MLATFPVYPLTASKTEALALDIRFSLIHVTDISDKNPVHSS
jgi:hypothetical protein